MTDTDTPNDTARDTAKDGGFLEIAKTKVDLWLVVIFMALAFGAGIAVMVMYQEPQPVVGIQQPAGQLPQAPPLTDAEIQAGLPSGHPNLGGTGATGATGGAGAGQASGNTGGGDGATGSG